MGIVKDYLDPNAAAYTDDEIVGKVNSASANITRAGCIEGTAASALDLDDISEGSTNKHLTATKDSKLTGIEDGATGDQSATEVRDLIVGMADDDRKIVISRPTSGQYKVYAIQRHSDGKSEVERSDTAES